MHWAGRMIEHLTHREEYEDRIKLLETRVAQYEELKNYIQVLNDKYTSLKQSQDARSSVLEKDRTELFARIDAIQKDHTELSADIQALLKEENMRASILEKDRTELFSRFDGINIRLRNCGLLNLNSRIDSRIIRLEILSYYNDEEHRKELDNEQLALLKTLQNQYDYERSDGRTYPEDTYYNSPKEKPLPFLMGEEDGLWYADVNGEKVFFGENQADAEAYLRETVHWLEGDTPHQYLDPASDGVDIPEGAVLCDVGAAEGYLGMRYLDRCKKVYFFEYDPRWLKYLKRTCAPYKDKIEIVEGYVGDGPSDIHLDEFFQNREKPTVIKMDIEGAEGAALRGMPELLQNPSLPLTLLICTYHRQEDWNRYSKLLGEQYRITSSHGYYWNIQDPFPPFFRHGIMRAVKKIAKENP